LIVIVYYCFAIASYVCLVFVINC